MKDGYSGKEPETSLKHFVISQDMNHSFDLVDSVPDP